MGNMSYCRYENTAKDLMDCVNALCDADVNEPLSSPRLASCHSNSGVILAQHGSRVSLKAPLTGCRFASTNPPAAQFEAKSRATAGGLGLAGGLCTGWVGWGAAQILTPFLPVAGATPLQSSALSLCTLFGITVSSGVKFLSDGAADYKRAAALGIPALLCAPIGAALASRVLGRTLQVSFAYSTVVMMPLMGLFFFWKSQKNGAPTAANKTAAVPPPAVAEQTMHAAFGGGLGLFCGFLGVAGLPFVLAWLSSMLFMEPIMPSKVFTTSAILSVLSLRRLLDLLQPWTARCKRGTGGWSGQHWRR